MLFMAIPIWKYMIIVSTFGTCGLKTLFLGIPVSICNTNSIRVLEKDGLGIYIYFSV
jgi:hypothetical protein